MRDDRTASARIPTVRLYGSAIALVSGAYSVWASSTVATASSWLMLALGVVVILHGVVLLTELAARLGDASGPLMIGYSALMLANQGWMATMDRGTMDGGTMNGGMSSVGMSWDPGMAALAVLMLASGLIMTRRRGMA